MTVPAHPAYIPSQCKRLKAFSVHLEFVKGRTGVFLQPIDGQNPDMTYVITQPCIGVKDKSCIDVCPMDCIHGTEQDNMLYIDPEECIDCNGCVPVCPVNAIFPENEVPEKWKEYTRINADYFKGKR